MKLSGVSIFLEYAKKFTVKCRPRSCPRPRIYHFYLDFHLRESFLGVQQNCKVLQG